MLGLGIGALPATIRAVVPTALIDVVEIDAVCPPSPDFFIDFVLCFAHFYGRITNFFLFFFLLLFIYLFLGGNKKIYLNYHQPGC